MKQLTQWENKVGSSAWGNTVKYDMATFEVEDSDVNRQWDHYLGYKHREYQFTEADVGKVVLIQRDGTGWTCWSFGAQQS